MNGGQASNPSDVTSGRLLRNTIAGGVAQFGSAIVTFLLTPFLLSRLGPAEYGVWLLALSFTFTAGYLAVADFGMTDAAVRLIAQARAERGARATEEINQVVSTVAVATAAIGLAVAGVAVFVAPAMVGVLGVDPRLHNIGRTVFTLMALEIAVELPAAPFRAVIEGAQRVGLLRGLDLTGRLTWAGVVVIVVSGGGGARGMAAASLTIAGCRLVLAALFARRIQPDLEVGRRHVRRSTLRSTVSYGSIVGGLRILSVIYAQMDRVIIGVLIAASAVAEYEIAYRILSLATLVLVVASSAVLPAAAFNAARRDDDKQRELYLRGTKYNIALVVPVVVAALMYTDDLISLWVGPEYVYLASAARLFLVFPLFACTNQVGVTMLIGLGRARAVLRLQLLAVGVNLVLSLILAPSLGIRGVVIGTMIGGLVAWPGYVWTLLREMRVGLTTWLRRVIAPHAPGVLSQLAFIAAISATGMSLRSPLALGATSGASMLISLVGFFSMGMSTDERKHLSSRLVYGDVA